MGGLNIGSAYRLATNLNDLSSDYALRMRQSFEFDGIDYHAFTGAILSSVVPQLNRAIRSAVKKVTGLDCMVVGAGIKTGVNVKIDDPGTLAGDLITGAVGALAMFKPPLSTQPMTTLVLPTSMVSIIALPHFLSGTDDSRNAGTEHHVHDELNKEVHARKSEHDISHKILSACHGREGVGKEHHHADDK